MGGNDGLQTAVVVREPNRRTSAKRARRRSSAPPQTQTRRGPKPKRRCCGALGTLFNLILLALFVVAAVATIAIYGDQLFGNNVDLGLEPSDGAIIVNEEDELRDGNNYIGLFLSAELNASVEAKAAFVDAAARWSLILEGNSFPSFTIPAGNICGVSFFAPQAFQLDHLAIGAALREIDGVGGILGQAGPCILEDDDDFPVFGNMEFDFEDVNDLFNDGTLTDVILHEMGHVIGIGTLWTRSVQGDIRSGLQDANDRLIANQVIADNGVVVNDGIVQPTFRGNAANAEFVSIGGVGDVPTEDGRDEFNVIINGQSDIANTGGSTDGHWEQEVFTNELMTFQISAGENHPLSNVTIFSLQDMGYIINTDEADFFTLVGSRKRSNFLRGSKKIHTLENDILYYL